MNSGAAERPEPRGQGRTASPSAAGGREQGAGVGSGPGSGSGGGWALPGGGASGEGSALPPAVSERQRKVGFPEEPLFAGPTPSSLLESSGARQSAV